MTWRHRLEELAPGFSQKSLDPVSNDGRADRAGNRQAEARHSAHVLVAGEPVQDEVTRRRRLAATIDGVEVPRTRESAAALHLRASQAERRLRPLARRRLRIARPPREAIRALNPCRRFRRRTFGWYVRFKVSSLSRGWRGRASGQYRRPVRAEVFHSRGDVGLSRNRCSARLDVV